MDYNLALGIIIGLVVLMGVAIILVPMVDDDDYEDKEDDFDGEDIE